MSFKCPAYRFRRPLLLVLMLFSLTFTSGTAHSQSTLTLVSELAGNVDTVRALNAGAAEPLLLLANDTEKKLLLYKISKGAATKVAESTSLGHVWEASLVGDGKTGNIVVAYGLGRGDLNAPLRVVSYPLTLDTPTEVHVFPTERSQMNFMKAEGDQVTVTWFTSKYETETGKLVRSADKKWRYEKIHALRMGTSSDAGKGLVVIGRMYGDKQAQDGDLVVKNGNGPVIKMPSYRGVSSVALYPLSKDGRPNILIGDGWHSNYGQLAEARFSMLIPVPGTSRYSLDLLNTFEGAYAVNRIFPTGETLDAPVILATNNHVYRARPGESWNFTELYTQKNTDKVFDLQYAGSSPTDLYLLISDGSATLYKIAR